MLGHVMMEASLLERKLAREKAIKEMAMTTTYCIIQRACDGWVLPPRRVSASWPRLADPKTEGPKLYATLGDAALQLDQLPTEWQVDLHVVAVDLAPTTTAKETEWRIVKRAPAHNYQSDYDVSVGLVQSISDETQRLGQPADIFPFDADEVLSMLLDGKTIRVVNPFGTEVLWTLEKRERR